jgi:cytochrome c biogenesis protein CcmG/thiol:disulfide interchange protein DsbE
MTMTQPKAADPEFEAPVRQRHTARWVAITVGVVLALFVGLLATRPAADKAHADSPLLGRPAPATSGAVVNFVAPSPGTNGPTSSNVDLADLHGKFVLVNFFASWCIPCQDEQPDLVSFNQRHVVAGDAAVVGIVYDDRPDAVRSYLSSHGGDWPVIDSSAAKVDWGVRGVPESFLVDPDGIVLFHMVGGVRDSDLETLLRQAEQARTP